MGGVKKFLALVLVFTLVIVSGVYFARNSFFGEQFQGQVIPVGQGGDIEIDLPADVSTIAGEQFSIDMLMTSQESVDGLVGEIDAADLSPQGLQLHSDYEQVAGGVVGDKETIAALRTGDPVSPFTLMVMNFVPEEAGDFTIELSFQLAVGGEAELFSHTIDVEVLPGLGAAPVCGDGTVEDPEECDDSGESETCDIDCTEALCGDAHLNVTAKETCEDGNTDSGDGCDEFCIDEDDVVECGNAIWEVGEQCDDGNLEDGDGCSSLCEVEVGPVCTLSPEGDDVSVDTDITITCGELMDSDSVESAFTIVATGVNDALAGAMVTADDMTFTFTPDEALDLDTTYTATLTTDATSQASVQLVNDVESMFTTVDSVLPQVTMPPAVEGLPYTVSVSEFVQDALVTAVDFDLVGYTFDVDTQTITFASAPAAGEYTGTLTLADGSQVEVLITVLDVADFIVPDGISRSLMITTLIGDVLSGKLVISGDPYYDSVYVINTVLLANP